MSGGTTDGKARRGLSVLRRGPVLIVLAIIGLGAAVAVWSTGGSASNPAFRLAKVERGTIASTVSASGTLSAVTTVTIGSQVSGRIKELLADFNTEVKAGQIIARLDPASFEASVRQAEADLQLAKANVSNAKAGMIAAQAEIDHAAAAQLQARQDLDRKRALTSRGVVSQSVIEAAIATDTQATAALDSAKAKRAQQEAQLETAVATVAMKDAILSQKRIDLENSIIRSPVDGVVISRSVDIGQTVAASLQAPILFTIAKDLRKMRVEVSVDEADIGRIRENQSASFTVDSFPGREFPGTVTQIRMASTVVQNVVTYTVVVSADNPALQLLPGMTANVQILVDERPDVLKVANAALRFRPAGAEIGPVGGPEGTGASRDGARGGPPSPDAIVARLSDALSLSPEQQQQVRAILAEAGEKTASLRRKGAAADEIRMAALADRERGRQAIAAILSPEQRETFLSMQNSRQAQPNRRGRLWIVGSGGRPEPVDIVIGISDGSVTEIVRGNLEEGQPVIVGTAGPAESRAQGRSPRFGF